jgi:hypothetical protein
MNSGDQAIHLAGDRSGVNGRDGSDSVEIDAEIALLRGRDGERHRAATSASTAACGGRIWRIFAVQHKIDADPEGQKDYHPDKNTDSVTAARRRRGQLMV